MGCNCGGSAARSTAKPRQIRRDALKTQKPATASGPPRPLRTGGPGTPGYVWRGPRSRRK